MPSGGIKNVFRSAAFSYTAVSPRFCLPEQRRTANVRYLSTGPGHQLVLRNKRVYYKFGIKPVPDDKTLMEENLTGGK